MHPFISHDRADETIEAKARWFQSLTMEERMVIFNDYMELILSANPSIAAKKYARPAQAGIQIISRS